ncbi:MAG TPA: esterase [Flavobacteriaceae bacterium]|nr:esterase [Flavobacteriaceae bacterium]
MELWKSFIHSLDFLSFVKVQNHLNMASNEKQVSYKTTNSYSTLNQLNENTKNVWISFHGLGYLSRYFIRYFSGLNKEENYIIAPQAPSKYYQEKDFQYVGANWLTRENTLEDTKNILNYLDAIFQTENLPADRRLILFGYSQGVSVCMRWMASRKIQCDMLVIHSGGIPKELVSENFAYLRKAEVVLVYGKDDGYLTPEMEKSQSEFAKKLFGEKLSIVPFEGKHEVNREVIRKIASNTQF